MMWLRRLIVRICSKKQYVIFVTYKEEGRFRDEYMVTESLQMAEEIYRNNLTDSRTYSAGISRLIKGTDWL